MVTRIKPEKYLSPLAIPPGETIREIIEANGMTQSELATRMGRSPQEITYLIRGDRAITLTTAKQLEYVLRIKTSFWMNLERDYQETLLRLKEQERIRQQADRVRHFPYAEMVKRGLVEATRKPTERVENLLNFFRVADFNALENHIHKTAGVNLFRKSEKFNLSTPVLATWLRIGELQIEEIKLGHFNRKKFERQLPELRALTCLPFSEALAQLREHGIQSGVAITVVRGFQGLPVWGIARWIGKNPCIQLSHRYKTTDHFWFSLFHEIGHILLHKKGDFHIDFDKQSSQKSGLDEAADRFACDLLIPPGDYEKLRSMNTVTATSIREFAREIGTAPGIVVGRLQHDGVIAHSYLNEVKERL